MERQERPRRHRRVRETAATRYTPAPEVGEVAGVLLDSDVIIEILRGRRRACEAAAALSREGIRSYCCAVSFAEVYAGMRPGEEALTEAFFGARGEVVMDSQTGRRAGGYLARYGKSHSLELADALVAATASTAGLRLW